MMKWVYLPVLARWMVVWSMLPLAACGHALVVESAPGDAEVFIGADPGILGRSLGRTPLRVPISEAIPGGYGYVTVQKPGYERVTTLITRGSFGASEQLFQVHLKPGDSSGTLASKLLVRVRNAQRFASALQFAEAHQQIDEALRIDPSFVFGKSFKAGIFFLQKKWSEARALYQEVLAADPTYEEAVKMLSRIESKITAGGVPSNP